MKLQDELVELHVAVVGLVAVTLAYGVQQVLQVVDQRHLAGVSTELDAVTKVWVVQDDLKDAVPPAAEAKVHET